MPAAQQVVKRNYIAIVRDTAEEQRALDSVASSNPRVWDYLLDLLAALLRRRLA